MTPKNYTDLAVYKESFELFVEIHKFSMRLPRYELYEQGSQLRRSSDSVNSNVVEGYGRKAYKNDFIRFLTYSHASNDETINHLRKIAAVHPHLEEDAQVLIHRYNLLGAKLYNFKQYVHSNWKSRR